MASWPAHLAALAAMAFSLAPERAALLADRTPPNWPTAHICSAQTEETAATGVFHGVGLVTAIEAASGALTLDHDDIVGLMPAMVMMYRVKSRDLGRALNVGDRIAFDLDAKTYTILDVQRLRREN